MRTTLPNRTEVTGCVTSRARRDPARRWTLPADKSHATIHRSVSSDGICTLTFDQPGSSANVFNMATLAELDEHLVFLESQTGLAGLILASAKPSIFIAGADLHAIAGMSKDVERMESLIKLGQSLFSRLAALQVPKVATIHGACVGGGFELALACDYRIASLDKVTKLGLPETQLGLIPAWGGCTRLPRLIGLPKALAVILGGKVLAAKPALKQGLVDELAPKENLVELARARLLSGGARPRRKSHLLTNNALSSRLIAARIHSQLLKKTRGHYPALFKALKVASRGACMSLDESLALERKAILELAASDATRNLLNVFLMQERSRKLVPKGALEKRGAFASAKGAPQITRAAVVGAGVMGAGIAQWLSSRGLPVLLTDISPEAVGKGLSRIADLYEAGVKHHVFTTTEMRQGMDRVSPATGEVPLHSTDIVIEAAVEKMDLKKSIFHSLARRCGSQTILATNTSALSVSELAASTPCPERVVGVHFFNPVHRMQLVEVIRGEHTSGEVLARTVRFVESIGKLPVVVKDSPGFVVNRVLMPYLVEAVHLFEQGAHIRDIDDAMLEFGMPMGPLRLIDEIGADVAHHVALTLAGPFKDRLVMPATLEKMVHSRLLGRKTDQGFYLHNTKAPAPNEALSMFRTGTDAANLDREALRNRLVLPMINEAARCVEEGIVESPEDVDFAMIMGTGFAPFRGGPLRYADSLGAKRVVSELELLTEKVCWSYQPCELLKRFATTGARFHEDV